jgi:hypothetical protein
LGSRVPISKFSPAYLVDSDLYVRNTVALSYAESLRVGIPVGRLQGLLVYPVPALPSTYRLLLRMMGTKRCIRAKFPPNSA